MSKENDKDTNRDKYNGFLAGMLLQFVNPKGILYSITCNFHLWLFPITLQISDYYFFSVLLAVIGFMGTFSWNVFGSIFKKFLSKYRSQFNRITALLLVYSAVSILIK